MTDYFYLDETHKILTGPEAREALSHQNDAQYLTDGQGVVRVPLSRWETAQQFERRYWMEMNPDAKEDRNEDHFQYFEGFSVLRGRQFDHAIELGCGPFTNLRLIAQVCSVKECTLLDPLVETYLTHPNRTYDQHLLHSETNPLYHALGKSKPLRAGRRVLRKLWPASLKMTTKIGRLLPCAIEDMPVDRTYDLIVIINVIEHCYDVQRVFENVRALAHPGTVLVFADRYYSHETVANWVQGKRYDAGHPLMVDQRVIDEFLDSACEVLYRNVHHHEWVVDGFDLGHDAVYFVGQMRGGQA
ncbi:MAG TPA: class I SAM-dependent methyltransferase [Blastocatellia bacterium]|nr:class I SAM-dependent methyltransferase [Blastocatellia bacterium]